MDKISFFIICLFYSLIYSQEIESRFCGGLTLPIGLEVGVLTETELPKTKEIKIIGKGTILWAPIFNNKSLSLIRGRLYPCGYSEASSIVRRPLCPFGSLFRDARRGILPRVVPLRVLPRVGGFHDQTFLSHRCRSVFLYRHCFAWRRGLCFPAFTDGRRQRFHYGADREKRFDIGRPNRGRERAAGAGRGNQERHRPVDHGSGEPGEDGGRGIFL
jgi:hypothetical protein